MRNCSKPMMLISVAGIIVLFLVGFIILDRLTRHEKELAIAAFVNGEPIYALELQKRMEMERHGIAMDYYHNHGIEESPAFWISEYEGEIPLQRLREKALEQSIRVKLQQILARSKGLIEDITYSAFLKSFAEENARRKAAVSNNEIIYGPLQYAEEAYFEYAMANLLIGLKAQLTGAEIPLTETLLRQYYNTIKEQSYTNEGSVRVHKIRIAYIDKDGTINRVKKAQALEQIQQAQQKLEQGDSFTTLAERYNETDEEKRSSGLQVFDRSTAREDQLSGAKLREEAMKLEAGQTSGIIEANNAFYLLKSISRLPGEAQPFEQVQSDVKKKVVEQKFAELIDRMVQEAVVEIRHTVYDYLLLP